MDIKLAVKKLSYKEDLSFDEMYSLMIKILSGELTDAQIGAVMMGLSVKGETIDEITASAKAMRVLSQSVELDNDLLLDTCGTGGASLGIFNVSTASAILAAACGVSVAKHGNRTATRKSGSADLLEEAGININLSPKSVKKCINKIGIGFMFAPLHHSAMKYAIGPRKELGIKSIFNILGPLTNPARASYQIMGVYKKDLILPITQVLKSLGTKRAMIVHSEDGLDEISVVKKTFVSELHNNQIKSYKIDPKDYGFNFSSLEELKVDSSTESLKKVKSGLSGENEIASSIIALNAGAGIYLVGLAGSLKEGIEIAQDAILNKKGLVKLDEWIQLSKKLEN
ncbi:MAG: anthranilate phosphoribosyltransferase [SAR86 cluster bacterium]|nr:anthranilate phosphoribosyltransferase [SAR86 cluster bacterium]